MGRATCAPKGKGISLSFNDEANHDQEPNPDKGRRLFSRSKVEVTNPLSPIDSKAAVERVLRANSAIMQEVGEQDTAHIKAALRSIEAVLFTIDGVRDVIEEMYEIVISAHDVDDLGGRALLAESYDELRLSTNAIVERQDRKARFLLGTEQKPIDVPISGMAHYTISPICLETGPRGLNLLPPRDAFATLEEIDQVLDNLDNAMRKLDRAVNSYCRDTQFLMSRLDRNQVR